MDQTHNSGGTNPGKTELTIPKLGFGTSSLGDMPATYGYGVDEDRALTTIRAIFDCPDCFLDTARNYGSGRSEERIGRVIAEMGGLAEGFVLSTKLDRDMETGRFDADRARRSLEESLKSLGLNKIPLLHLHDPEHAASLDEITGKTGAIAELFKMKEEGLADAVGLAAGDVTIMTPLLKDWNFDALITHNRFNLANRNAGDMIDLAVDRNIIVLNAAPYCGGALAKGVDAYPRYVYQKADEDMLQPLRRIEAICARYGVPAGAAALQFSMRDPRIGATICGITKPERIEQTLEWARWPIEDQMWKELEKLEPATDDPEATRAYEAD